MSDTTVSKIFLLFNGGPVQFNGESHILQGKISFEFPHEIAKVNPIVLDCIREDVKSWLETKCTSSGLKHCMKYFQEALFLHSYLVTKSVHQLQSCSNCESDKICDCNRLKLRSFALLTLILWIGESLADHPSLKNEPPEDSQEKDRLPALYTLMADVYFDILTLEYKTKIELDAAILDSGIVGLENEDSEFGSIFTAFYLTFDLIHQLVDQFQWTAQQTHYFAKYMRYVYDHETWLGKRPLKQEEDLQLWKSRRYYGDAGLVYVELCCLLDGLHLEIVERKEKHLKQLKFEIFLQAAFINALFSAKEKLTKGENAYLLKHYCTTRGLDFEGSVKKICAKIDEIQEQGREDFEWLSSEYENSSNILKYMEVLRSVAGHNVQFLLTAEERYGKFEWSVVDE